MVSALAQMTIANPSMLKIGTILRLKFHPMYGKTVLEYGLQVTARIDLVRFVP